jgi:hypothetical protein
MKRKVVSAEPKGNGTLLTFEDGSTEFLEGVTASLSQKVDAPNLDLSKDDEEETLLSQLKRD